jgi:RNA polymerase sigma-70 factor (ECF subfamily)
MGLTDEELISRIAVRDPAALAALYDRHAPNLFGLLVRMIRNRATAEDVLQETFLQIWSQADRFDPQRGAAPVWIVLIARSRALDAIRKVRRPTPPPPPEAPEPHENGLEPHLDRIPAEQARAIRLAFFEGLTHEEIARRENLPLGTVKTRIRLGMDHLRRILPARHEVPHHE